jgi:hypothetical protein
MRDGLHRVTSRSSVEGTRDVDRTNASYGGCALRPTASGLSPVLVTKIRSFSIDLAARSRVALDLQSGFGKRSNTKI